MAKYFDKELQEKHYERDMIGLRSNVPMNGIKETPYIAGELRDRPSKALHIEVHRDCCDTIKRDIEEMLEKKQVSRNLQPREKYNLFPNTIGIKVKRTRIEKLRDASRSKNSFRLSLVQRKFPNLRISTTRSHR